MRATSPSMACGEIREWLFAEWHIRAGVLDFPEPLSFPTWTPLASSASSTKITSCGVRRLCRRPNQCGNQGRGPMHCTAMCLSSCAIRISMRELFRPGSSWPHSSRINLAARRAARSRKIRSSSSGIIRETGMLWAYRPDRWQFQPRLSAAAIFSAPALESALSARTVQGAYWANTLGRGAGLRRDSG